MWKVANVRVVMNQAGVKALLQGSEVQAMLTAKAEAIQQAAGGAVNFDVDLTVGKKRARAAVITANTEGKKDEAEDRALSNALNAGRG